MAVELAEIALMHEDASDAKGAANGTLNLLIARTKAGDSLAFDQLMILCQHRVAGLAWRLLGNSEDARDATQEVFLRVYKSLKSYREDLDFYGWLYRIGVNVCRDLRRKRRHQREEDDLQNPIVDYPSHERCVEEDILQSQRRAMVARALNTLSEKERAAIVLRDMEGLSTEEVGQILGMRPVTVRVHISRGRIKIRDYCKLLQGMKGSRV